MVGGWGGRFPVGPGPVSHVDPWWFPTLPWALAPTGPWDVEGVFVTDPWVVHGGVDVEAQCRPVRFEGLPRDNDGLGRVDCPLGPKSFSDAWDRTTENGVEVLDYAEDGAPRRSGCRLYPLRCPTRS